ncbi:MAG: acetyl-CoA carboxylase biotin carboxyl carrier protein [Candidatus Acidiferrales bacterium]|jgi:acetyl-CoA carboxylase biotin carboxyl carrier protein
MAKKAKPEAGAGTDVRGVDLAEVKRLLAFMQENGLEEFEYERRGVHIRLKRASAHPAPAHRPAATAETAGGAHAAAAAGGHERAREVAHAEDVHVVKSPIVGTFYSAPSPEAEPFVLVGSRVETGQVLCIIEAMKLMNEIESDVAGEVVQVFVENGHPVEYGAALFGIRVQGKK